ncbi:hypothetical protein BASA81_001010 [Batrachochytrium salamandrivorans]|nr:hypothetical protein BASA81_001010 [Batrachochytrium salamandrivorans]
MAPTARPKRKAAMKMEKFEQDSTASSSPSSSVEQKPPPKTRPARGKKAADTEAKPQPLAKRKPTAAASKKKTPVSTPPAEEEVSLPVQQCFNNLDSALDVERESDKLCKFFELDFDNTHAAFTLCLHNLLLEYKTTPQIALCVELVRAVVLKQSPEFQINFLEQLISLTKAKDRAVRLRAVNLIRAWLRAQTEILEDLHQPLVSCLLDCTLDKNALVRQEAVWGLEYFQDPTNPKDLVVSRLCQMCNEDAIAAVRKTCIRVLVPNELSIQTLVDRARDESSEVRLQVFREFRDRFQIEWFSSADLGMIFDQGLADPITKEACAQVLTKWFAAKANVISFLASFDVCDANERTILTILEELGVPKVSSHGGGDGENGEYEGDTTESSILLRFLAKPQNGDVRPLETFERMLGEMQTEVEDEEEIAFICKNLLLAGLQSVQELDRASKDRISRQLTQSLLVTNFPLALLDQMMPVLRQCFASVKEFVFHLVTNVLSALSEQSPLEQTRADLVKAQQLVDEYTKARDYSLLERLCAEIKTLQEREQQLLRDPTSAPPVSFSKLARACSVAAHMFRCLPRQTDDSLLGSTLDMVCIPGIQSPEVDTRKHAIELLGLISLYDVQACKSHGLILATSLLNNVGGEDLQVRLSALRVLFDLLLCHGPEAASSMEEFDALVQHLMAFLDMNCDEEIRLVAAHGLSKLLFLNRVAYPGLVQCLLIVLFHPSTSEPRLKQCLVTFFAEYNNTPAVLLASEPLVHAIMFPTPDSLCEDLPLDQVLDRLGFLLRPRDVGSSSEGWANLLLVKIASHPQHDAVKSLVRALTAIPFAVASPRTRYFTVLVSQLVGEDRASAKRMSKFISALGKLEGSSDPAAIADADADVKLEVHSKFASKEVLGEALKQLEKGPVLLLPCAMDEVAEGEDEDEQEDC